MFLLFYLLKQIFVVGKWEEVKCIAHIQALEVTFSGSQIVLRKFIYIKQSYIPVQHTGTIEPFMIKNV